MEESANRYKRRPKRKLCYKTTMQSALKDESRGTVSKGHVDRMFDDLDSPFCVLPSLLQLSDSDSEEIQAVGRATPLDVKATSAKSAKEDPLHPVRCTPVLSPELNIDHSDVPFQEPVNTSSPLEVSRGGNLAQTKTNNNGKMLSPIVSDCEEKKDAATIKPATDNKSAQQETSVTTAEKDHQSVPRNSSTKTPIWAFLQKVQDSNQSKTIVKSLTTVKAPTHPPDFEDDFLIVDDNVPFCFSIATKSTNKQNKNKESISGGNGREMDVPSKKLLKEQTTLQKTPKNTKEKKSEAKRRMTFNKNNPQRSRNKADDQPKAATGRQPDNQSVTPSSESPNEPLHPATRLPSAALDIDHLDVPFHEPVRTSSPLDESVSRNSAQTKTNNKDKMVSPIVSDCQEDAATIKPATDKKTLPPAKAPTPPPDLGDDFLTVDDVSFCVSIPTKSTSKQLKSKESSSDKGGLTDSWQRNEPSKKKLLKEQTARKKTPKNTRVKKNQLKHRNTPNKKNPQRPRNKADNQTKVAAGSLTDAQSVKPSVDLASPFDFDLEQPDTAEDSAARTVGKRKRNPPGEWWLGCPQTEAQPEVRGEVHSVKKSKANRGEPVNEASALPAKPKRLLKSTIKKVSKRSKKVQSKAKRALWKRSSEPSGDGAEQTEAWQQQQFPDRDSSPQLTSPLDFIEQPQNHHSEHQVFLRMYQKKVSGKPIPPSTTGSLEQLPEKRRSRLPGEWWKVTATPENAEAGLPSPKKSKLGVKAKAKQSRPSAKSPRQAVVLPPSRTTRDEEQAERVNTPAKVFSTRPLPNDGGAAQSHEVVVRVYTPDCATANRQGTFTVEGRRDNLEDGSCPEQEILQSGPVSMIELEAHHDADLPSTRRRLAELSVCDMCAPPLKPCTLPARDRNDLSEWLQLLFPTTLTGENHKNAAVSPDQFDWYFHKNGTMGIVEDLHCWNFSHGKMLLGSFMKKPLWVDHSATVVFFLLTSSVRVNVDCVESCVHAGNSFMVPCGHAYSIQNLAEQPAFLCFNRMLTESPD
ncbi:uncharacterized protein si:ch211-161h7.4 [Hippocampus zosterae]|uniref:uncharacterized protein si:ch211-161h7.4 n=1 Tax=Hippocampus zosterae TaxID=109293 RepID=UPI00223D1320|nr:uncharacterized protein si:ch211-161h7.4 [Hippocampus zosterae]